MRTVGMALLAVGGAVLMLYFGYYLVTLFLLNAEIPSVIRLAVAAVVVGFFLVLISLVRERYHDMKRESFRGIQK